MLNSSKNDGGKYNNSKTYCILMIRIVFPGSTSTAVGFRSSDDSYKRNFYSNPSQGSFRSHSRHNERYSSRQVDQKSSLPNHHFSSKFHFRLNKTYREVVGDQSTFRGGVKVKSPYLTSETALTGSMLQPHVCQMSKRHCPNTSGQNPGLVQLEVAEQQPLIGTAVPDIVTQSSKVLEWNIAKDFFRMAVANGALWVAEKCEAYIILGVVAYQLGQIGESDVFFEKTEQQASFTFPPVTVVFYKSINRTLKG